MPLDLLAAVVAAAATCVATSMDNLLLLVGFRTSGAAPSRGIALGYLTAVLLVSLLALASASVVEALLPFPLGWLGVAPIAVGIWHGVLAFRPPAEGPSAGTERAASGGFATVLATMLANSGDSFVVMTAFLGDTRSWLDGVAIATFAAMALVWIRVSSAVTERMRPDGPLQRIARYGLPILLICIGLYILADTPTDVPPVDPGTGP